MSDPNHMSAMEAMMWHIESDPWLAPNGGGITIYDRPLDWDLYRRSIAYAVSRVPRLRQRVAGGMAPISTPRWVPDHEFDLDWHLRRISAPGDGSLRGLLDYFTPWMQDGFDRTRPLWNYLVVDGLAEGRGAVLTKMHHTIADGEAVMEMIKSYTSFEPDAAPPPEVDLDAIIDAEPVEDVGAMATARDALGQGLKLQGELARRALRGVATVASSSGRTKAAGDAADLARTTTDQMHPAGSTLWAKRSRRRRAEVLSLDFERVHDASHQLGGSINDFFLTGAVEAATRYHQAAGHAPERFHVTFVVNTRAEGEQALNAFSPVPIELPAAPMRMRDRFSRVHELVATRRGEVHGAGPLSTLATVANLIPTSILTSVAREQSAHIDFATSNLPGFPVDSWVAGAKTLHSYPFGPPAGTAFNLTMLSMGPCLDVGLHLDPAAIDDPELLVSLLEDAYADLIDEARRG